MCHYDPSTGDQCHLKMNNGSVIFGRRFTAQEGGKWIVQVKAKLFPFSIARNFKYHKSLHLTGNCLGQLCVLLVRQQTGHCKCKQSDVMVLKLRQINNTMINVLIKRFIEKKHLQNCKLQYITAIE